MLPLDLQLNGYKGVDFNADGRASGRSGDLADTLAWEHGGFW